MGNMMGRKAAKAKRIRTSGHVHEYLLDPVRKRPRTSQSSRDARYIMSLCQQGRSATMQDLNKAGQEEEEPPPFPDAPLPRWQSRWEVEMRPDPRDVTTMLKSKTTLKPWKSMPLPTTEEAASTRKTTPTNSRNVSRRGRRRKTRNDRRAGIGSARTFLTDVEDSEKFERISVTSCSIDGFKMLYKNDARMESMFDMTSKLWHIEPKKRNMKWFLADTHHMKEQNPSEVVPRSVKPYTSIIKTIGHHRPTAIQQTIIEEE
ncbi:uncharacterized protein LOC128229423 [Mya arenaria]|uniref:uncharacterized protein LOC128229423 n=1 Tax=Mya arenaria TaxID=6604 RepID=UPI0022E331D0|nr:uncharacterized protein LOC128229423 [Mya arenaria]